MRKIWSDHSGNRIFVVSLHLLFSETVRLTSPDIKNEMATKYDDYNPEIYYEDKQSEAERSPEKPVVSETGQNVRRKKNGNSNGARRKKVRDAKNDGAETFVSKVKEWAGSLNVRLLLGIFLGFLGVYLTISFISYLHRRYGCHRVYVNRHGQRYTQCWRRGWGKTVRFSDKQKFRTRFRGDSCMAVRHDA